MILLCLLFLHHKMTQSVHFLPFIRIEKIDNHRKFLGEISKYITDSSSNETSVRLPTTDEETKMWMDAVLLKKSLHERDASIAEKKVSIAAKSQERWMTPLLVLIAAGSLIISSIYFSAGAKNAYADISNKLPSFLGQMTKIQEAISNFPLSISHAFTSIGTFIVKSAIAIGKMEFVVLKNSNLI